MGRFHLHEIEIITFLIKTVSLRARLNFGLKTVNLQHSSKDRNARTGQGFAKSTRVLQKVEEYKNKI